MSMVQENNNAHTGLHVMTWILIGFLIIFLVDTYKALRR